MKIVWIALGIAGIGAIALIVRKKEERKKEEGEILNVSTTNDTSSTEDVVIDISSPKEWIPAEIAFVDNLDKFKPLLRGVSKGHITNKKDWTSLVVSINNDELTSMWESAINKPELWITYLQTFGLQIDLLDPFEAFEEYKEMYETSDRTPLQIGKVYKVVHNCWIYTDENNQKSVALKGIVSLED